MILVPNTPTATHVSQPLNFVDGVASLSCTIIQFLEKTVLVSILPSPLESTALVLSPLWTVVTKPPAPRAPQVPQEQLVPLAETTTNSCVIQSLILAK